MAQSFDVIVIGSGPGGEGAAMQLAKQDKRVAIIESFSQLGGNCTHKGTIPSKALRHSIQMVAEYRQNPLFEKCINRMDISWPDLLRSSNRVIEKHVTMRERFYSRNNVEAFSGEGYFIDEHTVGVKGHDDEQLELKADHIIIATGSRPYRPPEVNFDHPCVVDSDTVLELQRTPRRVTIYGAGVIGCEYASIFANLDVKVNLVDTRDRLLSFLDDEITDALSYHLRDQGVVIMHNEQFDSVEEHPGSVTLKAQIGQRGAIGFVVLGQWSKR